MNMTRPIRGWVLALTAVLLAIPSFACAEGRFPSKPVNLIVPYPPGGSNDVFARALGKKLSDLWGQPVLVDNRPGAGASIGAAHVNKAAPDGYTLMLISSSFMTGAAIQTHWPFDPVKGFAPVAMIARGPMIFTVTNSLPVKNIAELVALARARPGKLTFGSSGQGSVNHFATELLMGSAGVQMSHVPYKGMSQATTDVTAGHIDLLVASAPSIMQQVRAGRLRAIGVTSSTATSLVPDVAPVSAAVPGYAFYLWWAVLAPPGLPRDMAAGFNTDINRIFQGADMREFLAREGAEPWLMTPAELGETMRAEVETWKKVAARAGIKGE